MNLNLNRRVKASGPPNAKLAVVGMAPSKHELAEDKPFVGPSGRILNAALAANGVSRSDVYVTNVLEFEIPSGASIFDIPSTILQNEIDRLNHELRAVGPNCVLVCGNDVLRAFLGLSSIQSWRGSILPSKQIAGLKCVATVHPSWIIRGMFKWESVFAYIDVKRAIEQSAFPEIRPPKRDALTGPSFRTAMDYIEECNKHDYVTFDIETAWWAKDRMGEIACVGLGFREDQALCIPLIRGGGAPYWSDNEEARIWRALANLLQNRDVGKIAQNASFEWIYFWSHKIYPTPLFIDTMLLHHCLYPDFGAAQQEWGLKRKFDEPGHGLAFITSHYTEEPYYKDDGRLWDPRQGDHKFWGYNCKDVMVTYEVAFKMMAEAKDEGVWDYYKQHYIRTFPHYCRMEWAGLQIDIELRNKAGIEMQNRIDELQHNINSTLGWKLNVNSPKDMARLLYTERKYQPKMKYNKQTKKKSITADKWALQAFAAKNPDDQILLWIMELRQVKDLKADVVDQKLHSDGRMHTHYNLGGTDGARSSSGRSILGTGTNLQNIPVRTTKVARRLFLPG